jgi:hypothetical protein
MISNQRVRVAVSVACSRTSFRGLGHLFLTTKKKRTIHTNSNGTRFETESRSAEYLLMPSFLSRYLEVVVSCRDSCLPSFGFRVGHIIPLDIFDNLLLPIFLEDDLEGLQTLISNGQCTIDSSLPHGASLVQVILS